MTKPLLHWPTPAAAASDLRRSQFPDRGRAPALLAFYGLEHHLRKCGMLSRKEKSLCPLGCFAARKDGCRSTTEPATFRSRDQSMRKINTSPISINCRQKLSIWLRKKNRRWCPKDLKTKSVPHDNGTMPVMVTVQRRRAATPSSDRSRGAGRAGYISLPEPPY